MKVGTIVELGQNNRVRLVRVVEKFSKNVTFTSASLSVNGNFTSLSVTLKNVGNVTFRVFGLTLHGEFNATRTWGRMDHEEEHEIIEKTHPNTIPFKVNGSSLIPLFGDQEDHEHDDEHDEIALSSLVLQPGQSVTLSFSGVIALHPDEDSMMSPAMVVTPIVDGNYTLRLMGEGYQTFNVTAVS
jgi:hypothetical protein